jgi:hypothetical protein
MMLPLGRRKLVPGASAPLLAFELLTGFAAAGVVTVRVTVTVAAWRWLPQPAESATSTPARMARSQVGNRALLTRPDQIVAYEDVSSCEESFANFDPCKHGCLEVRWRSRCRSPYAKDVLGS